MTGTGPFAGVLEPAYRRAAGDGVWRRDGSRSIPYSDGDGTERYLLDVLHAVSDPACDSDEPASRIRDWPSRYHLSPTRHNLLRTLSLPPGARVLEIGSGCGALTRYLAELGAAVLAVEGNDERAAVTSARCRGLSNVDVCRESFAELTIEARFDLVTLVGVLEYAPVFFGGAAPVAACLQEAKARLAPEGWLLIAIENRLGLKYFNGCGEDHTGRLFDSINDLYRPDTCITLGRRELESALRAAGFGAVEFLYPFPDYKLPRLVLREAALSRGDLDAGMLAAQFPADDYHGRARRLFSEARAWPVLHRNGLLPELANSFLVLAGRGGSRPPLREDGIAFTWASERRARYRTETVFREEAGGGLRVDKRRLHPDRAGPGYPRLRVDEDQPFVAGEPLGASLSRISFSANAHREYLRYLETYRRILDTFLIPGTATLPPDCLDCVPANLIADGRGGWTFIDREWEAEGPVPRQRVVFRAIVNDLCRLRQPGSLSLFGTAGTLGEFVRAAMSAAGETVDEAALSGLAGEEAALLEAVNLPGVTDGVYGELLGTALDLPPAAVFTPLPEPGGELESGTAGPAPTARDDTQEALEAARREVAALRESASYRLGNAQVRWLGAPLRWLRPRSRRPR